MSAPTDTLTIVNPSDRPIRVTLDTGAVVDVPRMGLALVPYLGERPQVVRSEPTTVNAPPRRPPGPVA